METEIVDEIQEYSTASLHVNEAENVLNRKDELFGENYNEKETKLSSIDVFDASGQVVPSQSCIKSETDANQNNEHLTVPKVSLEAMDCLEKSQNFLKQSEANQEKLISEHREEYAVKTFHWPPIGFKEQINGVKRSKPGTFDQFVSPTNEENKDNGNFTAEQVAETNKIIYTLSNETNPTEESSPTEHHNLTSILKKDNNQAKKTVHFRENIVSVKFYDISDEEDSDNDTVILSDPEDDDFRDQEVPFNTYDDYETNVYYPTSTSLNFIPQFTFPPVLKITNCELYDTIDDTDEQIMAIMEDNDGRQHPNDITTDEIYPEESISGCHNDHLTSKEVLSTNLDKMFHEESIDEHQDNQITSKKPSENNEEASEFIEMQTPLAKNEIDHSDVNALKNISGTSEAEALLENQQTPTNVKTALGTSDEELEEPTPVAQNGIEQQIERHDDQRYSIKVDNTIMENPEKMKAQVKAIEIRQAVSYEDTSDPQDGQRTCKDVTETETETGAEASKMKEAPTTTNKVEPLEEDLEIKAEKYVEETLGTKNLVVNECLSTLQTVNQSIENSAVIVNSTTGNETETKVPTTDENEIQVDSKVYTLLDALKSAPKNFTANETGCNTTKRHSSEENYVQQATSPERGTMVLINNPNPQFNTQRYYHQGSLTTANIGLPATDMTGPSGENMVSKLELITDDKARLAQVNVPRESKESSEVKVTPSSSSGRLASHGNCGSSLLWRGPRSINSLILDEDFQVFTIPTTKKEIIHQHSFTKEEITTPKIPLTNIESFELNILAGMWSVATEHCDKESKLEKYDHSFLSSPDHVNEFEETWEPAIEAEFPNKKQKTNFDQRYELWLKHGYLNSDTGVERYETEFQEHPKTKIRSATSLECENEDDTLSVGRDMHDLTTQIVPDMYNGQEQSKPMNDSSRVVPSSADDVIMNSTNTSLHCSRQSYKTLENVKSCITSYHQGLSSQTRQGRRKLRVGLSKSTKVKSLHPYWSKERIKESGSNF